MLNVDKVRSVGSALLNDNGRVLNNFTDEKEPNKSRNVPLEEFLYEAKLQRDREASPEYQDTAPAVSLWDLFKSNMIKNKNIGSVRKIGERAKQEQKYESPTKELKAKGDIIVSTESLSESLENANRMARSASWGSIFFLITTDILGPSSAPFAISELGYVPGSLLYFLFGVAAVYTGILLWRMFLKLDSIKYPIKNYGDIVGRTCGSTTRYCIDLLQSIQLLCNVAVIILGNGQSLSQMAKGKGCYTVLIFVWAIVGMIVGQIRSLQRYGFLANFAVWLNIFVIIVTTAVVSNLGPNIAAAQGTRPSGKSISPGPVATHAIIYMKNKKIFQSQLSSCMNMVYSYGGAMVFAEFMAEMRRPWDFWKGMISAQTFIFAIYLIYGLVVYSQQGQFVANPANQGISDSKWAWQTVCNAVSLVASLLAAGLYGNVGVKVVYETFFRRLLRFPSLECKFGRVIWIFAVIIYWAISFVIAAAIPHLSDLVTLVGAVCILQFSYTFPPIMLFVLSIRISAMKDDEGYDPSTKEVRRVDTWKNASRWIRGYKQRWVFNTINFIVFLASLTTAALGIYSSGESLASDFESGASSSFTCKSPVA